MTALQEFQRLESPALLSSGSGAQRRDVIVALGDATLTIIDQRASAISHWSLAAMHRINPGKEPALFAPGTDVPERIEVSDQTMSRAIQKVLDSVDRGRPHPGRLRTRALTLLVFGIILASIVWLPGAIQRYAASVLPWPTRAAIGEALMVEVRNLTGPTCNAPSGVQVLRSLTQQLLPNTPDSSVRILRGGATGATHLPGRIILLERGIVEDHETAEVVAGFILAEAVEADASDPILSLLDHTGLWATLTLVATGRLPDGALEGYAQAQLADPPDAPASEYLLPRFAAAGVPSTPYALALDITGESTLDLIEADPFTGQSPRPLMSDDTWIALQEICGV